jgi:hypothetical protein
MRFLEFTFQSLWHFIGIAIFLSIICKSLLLAWQMMWRHLTIRKHGYPPPYCDADGDIVEEEKSEEVSITNQ